MGGEGESKELGFFGLSVKEWLVVFAVIVFWTLFGWSTTQFTGYAWGLGWDHGWGAAMLPTLVITIAFGALLSKLSPKIRLRPQVVAVVYGAVLVITGYMENVTVNIWGQLIANKGGSRAETLGRFIPSYWAPSKSAISSAKYGMVSVPWPEWSAPLLWWSTWIILWYFFVTTLSNILYERWVKIEKLPFPYATLVNLTISTSMATKKDKAVSMRFKLMMVAVAIAFVIWIPQLILTAIPGLYILPPLYPLTPYIDLVIQPGLNEWFNTYLPGAAFDLNIWPWWIALCMLVPLDVLFTTWVWKFVFYDLLSSWLIMAGYIPKPAPRATSSVRWTQINGWMIWNPYMPETVWQIGGGFALAALAFYYALPSLKAFWGSVVGKSSGSSSEKPEWPLSPKIQLILLIVSAVGLLAMIGFTGIPMDLAIMLLLIVQFISLAGSRVRAEGGYLMVIGRNTIRSSITRLGQGLYPSMSGTTPLAQVEPGFVLWNRTWYTAVGHNHISVTQGAQMTTLEAYKIGSECDVHPRTMYVAQTIAVMFSIIVGFTISIVIWNAFGLINLPLTGGCMRDGDNMGSIIPTNTYNMPHWGSEWYGYIPNVIIGFLSVLAIGLASFRFPGFPLNPVGVVVGGSDVMKGGAAFAPTIIAWAMKYIILKVGGTKMYEEKAVPVAIGWMIGYAIGQVMSAAIIIAKWVVTL